MNPAFPSLRFPLWLSAIIILAGLALYTHGNGFSYDYHPDEPVKVRQLIRGELNFHHPLLLLSVADGFRELLGAGDNPQRVVEAGRLVSALFAVGGVLAFMWLGWLQGGPWVAGTVTAFLLPHHQVFELAHYLKEDTALFCGIGATFLALAWAARKKSAGSMAWLGAAAALAFSAKYLGAASLLVALVWLIFCKEPLVAARRRTFLFIFGGVFLAGIIGINFPFFLHFNTVQTSFEREIDLVVNGQGGVTRQIPNWQYTGIFLDNTNPIIWLGLLGCLSEGWRRRRAWTLAEWLPFAFSAVFVVALSFSAKSNDRYFLPLTGMICLAAGYGLTRLLALWKNGAGLWLGIPLALIGVLPGLVRYDRAFQIDDRNDLRVWMETHLPATANIVQEKTVRLPGSAEGDPGRPLPQTFSTPKLAPDLGTLAELRARGITHVLVSQSVYGKFFLKSLRPDTGGKALFTARQAFYSQLFRDGKKLWERPRSTVLYLHPGMELYQINPAPASP